MACKLKVKYNLDLYMFSPLEEDKKELAAIRRNFRPNKMSKQLKLLEADDVKKESVAFTDDEGNRSCCYSVRARNRSNIEVRERKSIRRASRANADMVAAIAAATAAAQAAGNAAQAAAQAAADVKGQGESKEKMHEAREQRRRERDNRRKSRIDKEALRDLLELQLKQHASEEAATEAQLSTCPETQPSKETQELLNRKQEMQQRLIEIEEKKKAVESALNVPDQEWWAAMKQQEEQSDEEWEALANEHGDEQQQQAQQQGSGQDNKNSLEEKQTNGTATTTAAVAKVKPEASNTTNDGARPSSVGHDEARKSVRLHDETKPAQTGAAKGTNAVRPGSARTSAPSESKLKASSAAAAAAAAAAASSEGRPATAESHNGSCADEEKSDARSESRADGPLGAKGTRQLNASDESSSAAKEPDTLTCTEEKHMEEEEEAQKDAKETSEDLKNAHSEVAAAARASHSSGADIALGGIGGAATTPKAEKDASQKDVDLLPNTGEVVKNVTGAKTQAMDDGSDLKARVSFAASTCGNNISIKGSPVGEQALEGEAKILVSDIVRRSSIKASDVCNAVISRASAA